MTLSCLLTMKILCLFYPSLHFSAQHLVLSGASICVKIWIIWERYIGIFSNYRQIIDIDLKLSVTLSHYRYRKCQGNYREKKYLLLTPTCESELRCATLKVLQNRKVKEEVGNEVGRSDREALWEFYPAALEAKFDKYCDISTLYLFSRLLTFSPTSLFGSTSIRAEL